MWYCVLNSGIHLSIVILVRVKVTIHCINVASHIMKWIFFS